MADAVTDAAASHGSSLRARRAATTGGDAGARRLLVGRRLLVADDDENNAWHAVINAGYNDLMRKERELAGSLSYSYDTSYDNDYDGSPIEDLFGAVDNVTWPNEYSGSYGLNGVARRATGGLSLY